MTAADHVIAFQAMAIALPDVQGHPNRMPFKGVLTRVDQASDEPPGGSLGKRVFIPADVAREALPTLLGMAVDCDPDGDFAGHEAKHKIGLITGADVVGDALEIEGFFYASDFPDLCRQIQREKALLGFSYECKVRIRDLKAQVWHIEECVFTGAAVLYKDKAAYRSTSLAASADKPKTAGELLAALTADITTLTASIGTITKDIADLKAFAATAPASNAQELRADREHHQRLEEQLAATVDRMSSMITMVKDLQAKAFTNAQPPERRTMSGEVMALFSKFDHVQADESGKLSVAAVDKALEAAGVRGQQAIEAKLKMRAAGVLQK